MASSSMIPGASGGIQTGAASILTTALEPSPPAEQGAGRRTVVEFAGNTKYLVGGGKLKAIQVRRVADGQQIASLEAEGVTCLAVPEDGRWIAAGTAKGDLLVWNAQTCEQVFSHKEPLAINELGFWVDSTGQTRFFASHNRAATDWDIASGQRMQIYDHEVEQTPIRSIPQSGTAAVTTENSIRIYDGYDGLFLAEIPVRATFPRVFSFGRRFLVISGDKIKDLDYTGSTIVEWTVPYSEHSRIAIPVHEEFIAYCADHTVSFWDASKHTRSGLMECPLEISSIAFSPNARLLAIGGLDGEVIIQDLRDGLPSSTHFTEAVFEDTLVAMQASSMDTTLTRYQSTHTSATASLVRVLIKRSKVYMADGLWELALNDANRVIELDPWSPWGYERKHAALYSAGDYDNALNTFETMLSKILQSSNLHIRKLHCHYINPTDTRVAIRRAIQDALRDSPPMLIDTTSGRLLDKAAQATSFESHPVFKTLLSSMTTIIDHTRIEHDVKQYYRYAMLSHTWQDDEPLFEEVIHAIIYNLENSPANDKLKMFCKIVQDAGIRWAWNDTCCVNRKDDSTLQEALVSTFRWYQGSALTLVLLCDVHSPSQYGGLLKSTWNTRAWAFQGYHASRVVRFYNEDWTLYRDIDVPNHKESPEILAEMEEATGISTGALEALQPGLDDIRLKLSLLSRQETSLVEDEAYSLLGIFAISLPVAYGDGDEVLGQLLAQILSDSGDASILAWTGQSGSFNTCLPRRIRVFSQLLTSHIPSPMTDAEKATTATLEASSLNLALVVNFYDRLQELPAPSFVGRQMRLPCLSFQLGSLTVSRTGAEQVFRAQSIGLGFVDLKTVEDLTQLGPLILVHPWIDFLLGRWSVEGTIAEEKLDVDDTAESLPSSRPSSPMSLIDRHTAAALRLITLLRQPFGALLLAPTGQDMTAYRRVAAESLITVQVQDVTLDYLMNSIRVLDVV